MFHMKHFFLILYLYIFIYVRIRHFSFFSHFQLLMFHVKHLLFFLNPNIPKGWIIIFCRFLSSIDPYVSRETFKFSFNYKAVTVQGGIAAPPELRAVSKEIRIWHVIYCRGYRMGVQNYVLFRKKSGFGT